MHLSTPLLQELKATRLISKITENPSMRYVYSCIMEIRHNFIKTAKLFQTKLYENHIILQALKSIMKLYAEKNHSLKIFLSVILWIVFHFKLGYKKSVNLNSCSHFRNQNMLQSMSEMTIEFSYILFLKFSYSVQPYISFFFVSKKYL